VWTGHIYRGKEWEERKMKQEERMTKSNNHMTKHKHEFPRHEKGILCLSFRAS
jgi:hypothetical protein